MSMRLNLEYISKNRFGNCPAPVNLSLRLGVAWLAALIFAFALTGSAKAQSPAQWAVSSNRFLFIVDTSGSMKRHAGETAGIVGRLLQSSADGQLYRGDTIGFWTYNREVYSDFPLQVWDTARRNEIVSLAAKFLEQEHYNGSSRFEKVLPNLFGVMRASDFLTVIIISNGEDKFKGTPFDDEINGFTRKNYSEAKGHGIPMVTIIQSKRGKIIFDSVTAYPWPIVIPKTPVPQTPPPPPPAVVAAPKPAPPVHHEVVPDLIIIGKPQPPPVIVKPQPAPVVIAPAPTTPEPLPAPTSNSPTVAALAPSPAPADIQPTTQEIQKTAPVATSNNTAPVTEPPFVVENKTPAPEAMTNALDSNTVSSRELASAPEPVERSNWLLIASIGLAVIALILIVFMILRSRENSESSFITRSMNDKKK
jgi:hypothetical protein